VSHRVTYCLGAPEAQGRPSQSYLHRLTALERCLGAFLTINGGADQDAGILASTVPAGHRIEVLGIRSDRCLPPARQRRLAAASMCASRLGIRTLLASISTSKVFRNAEAMV
jgi:hypothetical protein